MISIYKIKEFLNTGIRKYSDDEVECLYNTMICLAKIECEIRKNATFEHDNQKTKPVELRELTIESTEKWHLN